MKGESILYEANPSMFRNHPLWFILCVVLCVVVIGIPLLLYWWLDCKGKKLIVTSERSKVRTGILAKSTNEVWHKDVRNVQVDQTFMQRLFGVGKVSISSAGQSGVEIEVAGIPSPYSVREIIDQGRRASRKSSD